MNRHYFKNFKGYFSVEKYVDDDLCSNYRFVDENDRFLGHVETENINDVIDYLIHVKDEFDFFEYFENRYDYGLDYINIMKTYIEDISSGLLPNEFSDNLKEEIKDILFDIEYLDELEFCEKYDINKVGKYYFRGNW